MMTKKTKATRTQVRTETLATAMFEGINFKGEFLKQRVTRELVKEEQYIPSSVFDRGSVRAWKQGGGLDAVQRASARVDELLAAYQEPDLDTEKVNAMVSLVEKLAKEAGMEALPALD